MSDEKLNNDIIEVDLINDENFESNKDNLSNNVKKKVIKNIELSEKTIDIKNCEIDRLTLTNCNIEDILNSKISEMIFTKTESFEKKCNIKSIIRSQFGKVEIENVDFEDSHFVDCNFENDFTISKSRTKYTNEDSKDNTMNYGLRIIRCSSKESIVLVGINGTVNIQDTEATNFQISSSPLDRLTILRCSGEVIEISEKEKIKELRIVNSNFENNKPNTVLSDDETITKIFPNIYSGDFQITDSIITDSFIHKIIINKDSKIPLKLRHCYIKEIVFEEENIISIPIQITDSIIEIISVECESFTRAVDFTGTLFKNSFHLNEIRFNRYLQMQETTFEKDALIKKIFVESDLDLMSTRFRDIFLCSENRIDRNVIFNYSELKNKFTFEFSDFGRQLHAKKVKFKDETMFFQNKIANHVFFDDSEMEKKFTFKHSDLGGQLLALKVKFKDETMFIQNKIAGHVAFNESEIEKKFTFEFSTLGSQLLAKKVKFKDETMFSQNKVADHVVFEESEMEKKFTFEYSTLGGQLLAIKARFKEETLFSQNKIADHVFFDDSEMEKKFTFKYSDLGCKLLARGVKFKEETLFLENKISNHVVFDYSEMEKKFTFEKSSLGSKLSFDCVKFKDETMFDSNKIAGYVFFDGSEMENKFTFEYSTLGGELSVSRVTFNAYTRFSYNKIANRVLFNYSEMKKKFYFCDSSLGSKLSFECVKFKNDTNFYKNNIADDISFNDADIEGTFYFHNSFLGGELSYSCVNFKNKTQFGLNKITGLVRFGFSEFEKYFCFRDSVLNNRLLVEEVKFKNEAIFINNNITDVFDLEGSEFFSSLFVLKSNIENEFLLNNISVVDRIEICDSFIKDIYIHDPKCLETLFMYQNEINSLSFKNLSLEYLDFSNNIVRGNAYFGESDKSIPDISKSIKFLSISNFEKSRFYGQTIFNSSFGKLAYFANAQFYDDVHFDECVFNDKLDFTGCFVQNTISFIGAEFKYFVNLHSFLIDKKLILLDSKFRDKTSSINLSNGSYSDISLSKEQLTEFKKTKLFFEGILYNYRKYDTCLLNMENISDEFILKIIEKYNELKEINQISLTDKLNEVNPIRKELREKHYNRFEQLKKLQIIDHYLQNATNEEIAASIENKELVFNEKYELNNKLSKEKICDEVIDNYLILKDNFGKSGNHIDEDWAYYNLMHYKNMKDLYHKRENSKLKWIAAIPEYLKLLIFEKAFGWGVRLFNLFFTSLFVIFFFGGLYWVLGKVDPDVSLNFEGGVVQLDKFDLFGSVYLSLQSFISVIIGNLSPINSNILKGLITLESLIGILIITFLVGAYTRKILR